VPHDASSRDRRRGLSRWLACGFVAVVLSGCSYPFIRDGLIEQKQALVIETRVAYLRELDFTRQVPIVVKSPDQAQQIMITEIARDHSDDDLRIGGESGAMTGLYPPNIELKEQTLRLLRNEVIGFYDAETKQMVIVEPQTFHLWRLSEIADRSQLMGEMVLAHELTHGLQDQHFGIDAMLRRVKDNDDRTLALKSVAEGDATLAGFAYAAGHLDQSNVQLLVSRLASLPESSAAEMRDVPLAVSAPMLFQYSSGTSFVAEAWRRGGWPAVDRLYQHPPLSSQQIMQPALYFDHPTPPAHIELAGYQAVLKNWKKVDDDTYGELLLQLILQRNVAPHSPAFKAIPRWAGDRIITLQKDNKLTLLWLIAFLDTSAAKEFADAYGSILGHLRRESNPYGVEARAAAVLVAIGPGALDFTRLAGEVWKVSSISPVRPEPASGPSAPVITHDLSRAISRMVSPHYPSDTNQH
jgi:hypothetical protein